MITSQAVKERVQVPPVAESLSEDRIAYLEKLVSQGKVATTVFTQCAQEDEDRIVQRTGQLAREEKKAVV